MSQFTFIASRHPIPEIDLTDIKKVKIIDIRNKPNFPASLAHLSDDIEILYGEDGHTLSGLRVSPCTNPPYDLGHYIRLDFIYWLEGAFDSSTSVQQLIDYLQTFKTPVEIWSIAFGQGRLSVHDRTIRRVDLHSNDLNILHQRQSTYCLTLL